MELTISIKEQSKIQFLLQLLKEFEYVEILGIKDDNSEFPIEHQELLEKRLKSIELGKTSFKSWDLIKKKYEKKII
jgi:hypothetical protein